MAAEKDSDHGGVLVIRESVSSPDVIRGTAKRQKADLASRIVK